MTQRRTLTATILLTGSVLGWSAAAKSQEMAATEPAADLSATSAPQPHLPDTGEQQVSQVRIVRLSQVRGTVHMDRNTGRGYELAFANIPVVAGAKLRTLEGVAEIEFEDNSSLRLAPHTELQFVQLGRLASGATLTGIAVTGGVVYAALEKTKGNVFTVTDGSARVVLDPGAHLRLTAEQPNAQVAVFEGSAQLMMGATSTSLTKKQTVEISPVSQTVSAVTRGTEEGDWDGWDRQETDYHRQKANLASVGGFGLYGANDLNYYGSFSDVAGCGSVWRPYFASAAWDPFASGVWAYYPTQGYSWVSPYPWGWLPYHSGSWVNCGTSGWGWQPGGSWYGVQNQQALRLSTHRLPHPIATGTSRTEATLTAVNMRRINASGPNEANGFTIRQDSAGYGIPRSAFGNLHSFAQHVDRAGTVMRPMPEGVVRLVPGAAQRSEAELVMQRGGATLPSAGRGGPLSAATSMHTLAGQGSTHAALHSGTMASTGQSASVGNTSRGNFGGLSSGVSMSAPSAGSSHISAGSGSAAHK